MEGFYNTYKNRIAIDPDSIVQIIPVGKESAMTSTEIALKLGKSDGGTQVAVRAAIREAIEAGELIGSCSNGYYMITTDGELSEVLDGLEHREIGIRIRRKKILSNWNEKYSTIQASLFEKGA